jgi:hypothetical protein
MGPGRDAHYYVSAVPWLILSVVIRLSQNLSHACLSARHIKVKPRMAHEISYGSLDGEQFLG